MSGIRTYQSLGKLVTRLRDDLNDADLVLLYAYNRTGKTRLSMEFKDAGSASIRRRTRPARLTRSISTPSPRICSSGKTTSKAIASAACN